MDRPLALAQVTHELEELKLRLIALSASDVTDAETERMATEISAIRLQLRRLREEQLAARRAVALLDADDPIRRDSEHASALVTRITPA